jgi:hypothetical protein
MNNLKIFTLLILFIGTNSSFAEVKKPVDQQAMALATEIYLHAHLLHEMENECKSLKRDMDWRAPYNKFLADLENELPPQSQDKRELMNRVVLQTTFSEASVRAKDLVVEARHVNGCGTRRFQETYSEAEKLFSKSWLKWSQR